MGGWGQEPDGSWNCQNDMFYLDLSNPLNMSSIVELKFKVSTALPVRICWASSSLAEGGKKIYIFGGIILESISKESNESSSIYSFDINAQKWSAPKIKGIAPESRQHFQMVPDNKNNYLYIFGGSTGEITKNVKWLNDMNVLNTNEQYWQNMMILGSKEIIIPPFMADFTATMLSSGEIVYIGGRQSTSPNDVSYILAKMNVIYVFNTKSSSWNVINAGGNAPNSRIGHSAVLASNNRIIVYGGTSEDLKNPATPDLAILDVNLMPYQWISPNVTKGSPPSRSFHSAAMVQNLMFVAFGNVTTNSIYILDVSDNTNFRWSSSYIKSNQTPDATQGLQEIPSETPLNESLFTQNMALILGASIGGLISFIILASIGVLIYKKWRNYQKIIGRNRQYLEEIPSTQNSNN
ncbi:12130_t:CDS:2 [Funneliformis geosporum]|nr:12130_t:CDS:2 [Funneliformis geosporum]